MRRLPFYGMCIRFFRARRARTPQLVALLSAALLTGAADAADKAFLEALSAAAADAKFAAQGFVVLN